MDRYLDRLAGRKASAVTGEVILPAKKQRSPLIKSDAILVLPIQG